VFIVEMVTIGEDGGMPGGYFECGAKFWEGALVIGKQHGWEPMGTIPAPEDIDNFLKDGSYEANYEPIMYGYRKVVLSDDAVAWADALERALGEKSDKELENTSTQRHPPVISDEMKTEADYITANAGVYKKKLNEFAAFLKKGNFMFTWDD